MGSCPSEASVQTGLHYSITWLGVVLVLNQTVRESGTPLHYLSSCFPLPGMWNSLLLPESDYSQKPLSSDSRLILSFNVFFSFNPQSLPRSLFTTLSLVYCDSPLISPSPFFSPFSSPLLSLPFENAGMWGRGVL